MILVYQKFTSVGKVRLFTFFQPLFILMSSIYLDKKENFILVYCPSEYHSYILSEMSHSRIEVKKKYL